MLPQNVYGTGTYIPRNWFFQKKVVSHIFFPKVLKIEHENDYDQMQIWLPAFKKIKRISSKKRSDSFMGSDMSFEDMSSRQLDEYTFEIMDNKIYDSISCYFNRGLYLWMEKRSLRVGINKYEFIRTKRNTARI